MADFPKLSDILGQSESKAILSDFKPVEPGQPAIRERPVSVYDLIFAGHQALTGSDPETSHRVASEFNTGTLGIPDMMKGGYDKLDEGTQYNDPWKRAEGAMQMAAPLMPGLGASPRVAKGILGGIGGGLGGAALYDVLGPQEAEAAKLRKSQERALQMEREKATIANDAAKQGRADELQAEIARKEADARIARESADKEAERIANRPFSEAWPTLNSAVPFASFLAPMAGGALMRAGATKAKNTLAGEWEDAIRAAEEARVAMSGKGRDPGNLAARTRELELRNEAHVPSKGLLDKTDVAAGIGGAGLGMEIGMLPTQYNATQIPASTEEGAAARKAVADPDFYKSQGMRAAMGALGGMSGSKYTGAAFPAREAPVARSKALAETMPKMSKADVKAQYQANLKSKSTELAKPKPDQKVIKQLENDNIRLQGMIDQLMREVRPQGGRN